MKILQSMMMFIVIGGGVSALVRLIWSLRLLGDVELFKKAFQNFRIHLTVFVLLPWSLFIVIDSDTPNSIGIITSCIFSVLLWHQERKILKYLVKAHEKHNQSKKGSVE